MPKTLTDKQLAVLDTPDKHTVFTSRKDDFPDNLRYPNKQPQVAAWIIHTYVPKEALATREELLFIWAGYVGARPEPAIRQLIQELDILAPRS